jgi:endonuclease YncB( thermonuclease family)
MYDYRAKLSDKVRDKGDDGDTVLMVLDLGLSHWAEESIRLAGVTAPESYQPGGRESAAQLRLILDEAADTAHARKLRWPFVVLTEPNTNPEPDERRSFVRYVGRVWASDAYVNSGPSVNQQMIAFLAVHPEWGPGIEVPFGDGG